MVSVNDYCIGCETFVSELVSLDIQMIDGSIIDLKLCRRCYGGFRASNEVVAVLVKS